MKQHAHLFMAKLHLQRENHTWNVRAYDQMNRLFFVFNIFFCCCFELYAIFELANRI